MESQTSGVDTQSADPTVDALARTDEALEDEALEKVHLEITTVTPSPLNGNGNGSSAKLSEEEAEDIRQEIEKILNAKPKPIAGIKHGLWRKFLLSLLPPKPRRVDFRTLHEQARRVNCAWLDLNLAPLTDYQIHQGLQSVAVRLSWQKVIGCEGDYVWMLKTTERDAVINEKRSREAFFKELPCTLSDEDWKRLLVAMLKRCGGEVSEKNLHAATYSLAPPLGYSLRLISSDIVAFRLRHSARMLAPFVKIRESLYAVPTFVLCKEPPEEAFLQTKQSANEAKGKPVVSETAKPCEVEQEVVQPTPEPTIWCPTSSTQWQDIVLDLLTDREEPWSQAEMLHRLKGQPWWEILGEDEVIRLLGQALQELQSEGVEELNGKYFVA